jgi:predicted nucleic acid-binding protein
LRVFLDSAPVIYLIEWHSIFGPKAANWLAANATELISSEITRVEALVIPIRVNDAVRIQDFEVFFANRLDELRMCDRLVYDRALQIRAALAFKLVDSLQLAISIESQCDVFLTSDLRLKRFTGITVEVI